MPADPYSSELAAAMLEEWKVVQAKIDKIGEFRFHIKNWALTITVAFIVGLFATNASPWLVLAGLLPTWAFFFVEHRQEKILTVLMRRADRLERAMKRVFASTRSSQEVDELVELLGAAGYIPGTARDLGILARSRAYRLWSFSEINFYIAQSLLILLAAWADVHRLDAVRDRDRRSTEQAREVKAIISPDKTFNERFDHVVNTLDRGNDGLARVVKLLSFSEFRPREWKPLPPASHKFPRIGG